jgi:hypothetical protein
MTGAALALLGVQSASADLVYRVVYGGASRVVTAVTPFGADQSLSGFIDIPFTTRTAGTFHAHNPPSDSGSAIPQVLDFRFSLGSFEWTTVGDHGVLGFIDVTGRISNAAMGFERDACGGFTPCFLDIYDDGKGGFNVQIYQPGIANGPPVIGYRAEGVGLVPDPLR